MLGIRKRGDSYLRTLLIHGARSVIFRTQQKADKSSGLHKPLELLERRNPHVAAVSLANDRNFQAR